MKSYQSEHNEEKHVVREEAAGYGRTNDQEDKQLQEALQRTDTEKFHFLMTLMKMGNTMKKAVIHHKY